MAESDGLLNDGASLFRGQIWTYFVTWWAYAANHITRKCYTNVKNVMITKGLGIDVIGRMDMVFMFTYAIGSPLAGQLGDRMPANKLIGIGLYGSAICIFALIFGIWEGFYVNPYFSNFWFLGFYFVFGFFQAIGGPVGTSVMGSWMCTPGAKKNRGLIFGTWTTHQYFGNILAPVIIVAVNNAAAAWWWGLMWPVVINIFFGILCYYFLSESPEASADKTPAGLSPVKEDSEIEEMAPVTIPQALAIPGVAGYCIAFGFMKLINYVLFFWLPLFLQKHFESDTANMISTLYDFGMMPGGIIVGAVSDAMDGRRGCVIVTFLAILCPLLAAMAVGADTMAVAPLMVMLATMGILIGGPNNIVTSAVAADLAEDPILKGNKKGLGTVVGLINGSGSLIAAFGQLVVPIITAGDHWPRLWWFMLCATATAIVLMGPKVYSEIFFWKLDAPVPAKKGYSSINTSEGEEKA